MSALVTAVLCCLLLICPLAGPTHACTSFCLDTPDGPVFAVNCDLFIPGDGLVFVNRRGIAKEGYLRSTTGEKAKWISEYGSVTFNVPGREFPREGMNEAGLVVSTMALDASELEGDVERFFTPYDHDVNLEVFSTFCDRWGIEVSAEGAVELMRFFESFECAR